MCDEPIMRELEPVVLSDNTEAKVPISVGMSRDLIRSCPSDLVSEPVGDCDQQVCPGQGQEVPLVPSAAMGEDMPDLSAAWLSSVDQSQGSIQPAQEPRSSVSQTATDETPRESSQNDDVITAVDTSDLEEYNKLRDLFKTLPLTMFVNQVLIDFCSNESELERTRSILFDALRSSDDFPFGLSCELKRRVHTRNGDSVPEKLAKDIYALVSVLEGEDYSSLNDLVSKQRSRGRGKSVSSVCASSSGTVSAVSEKSENVELKMLKDKLCSLEADLLLTKQRQIAIESTRSEEIRTLKKSISDTNIMFQQVSGEINSHCFTIKNMIQTMLHKQESAVINANNANVNVIRLSESVTGIQRQMMAMSSLLYNPVQTHVQLPNGQLGAPLSPGSPGSIYTATILNNGYRSSNGLHPDLVGLYMNTGGASAADNNLAPGLSGHCSADPNPANCPVESPQRSESGTPSQPETSQSSTLATVELPQTGANETPIPSDIPVNACIPCQNDAPEPTNDSGYMHNQDLPASTLDPTPKPSTQCETDDYPLVGNADISQGSETGTSNQSEAGGIPAVTAGGAAQVSTVRQTWSNVVMQSVACSNRESDRHFGGAQIPTIIDGQLQSKSNWDSNKPRRNTTVLTKAGVSNSRRNVVTKASGAGVSRPAFKDGEKIPVQIGRNLGPDDEDGTYDEAEFIKHVKRRNRTKRFYIGGCLPTISEFFIRSYVSERGFKPTKITIFRNWKNDSATIRLNVIVCPNLDELVGPQFWPRGVSCRPWVTRNQYQRDRGQNQYESYDRDNYDTHWSERPVREKVDTYNRYRTLSSDVD